MVPVVPLWRYDALIMAVAVASSRPGAIMLAICVKRQDTRKFMSALIVEWNSRGLRQRRNMCNCSDARPGNRILSHSITETIPDGLSARCCHLELPCRLVRKDQSILSNCSAL